MLKYIIYTLIVFLVTFISPNRAFAANNHFGIHIFDEGDLQDASNLVNSSGGEWGYVTFVIREDERDTARWQRVFDQMRRLKLIPIVRLATKNTNGVWQKPTEEEAINWSLFLNSLNWPVRTRYIILFNEPNHNYEWGGKSNPQEYAKIARAYLEKLKEASYDFFVMPAGLDLAAPTGRDTISADSFYRGVSAEDEYLWASFDGLTSHSYPNPGFSGDPEDTGQKSIQGYKWEIKELSQYGMAEDIPVFITETGWALSGKQTEDMITNNYIFAYNNVWDDPQIMAVTPFILNYINPPFDMFSWRDPVTHEYRQFYKEVQKMEKVKGTPEQLHSFQIEDVGIPAEVVSNSSYSFSLKIKNTGQSIWQTNDGFSVHFDTDMNRENIDISPIPYTEPGQVATIPVRIFTGLDKGDYFLSLLVNKDSEPIGPEIKTHFKVTSPPSITFRANFLFSGETTPVNLKINSSSDAWLFDNLLVDRGVGEVPAVYNIIPNKDYLFSLSKPGFLPSKVRHTLTPLKNEINFGTLLPFDINNDEKLDYADLVAYLRSPLLANLKILFP